MCIITPTGVDLYTHIKRRVNHANQGTLCHQSVCILLHTYAIWPATGQTRVTESALIQYKVNKPRIVWDYIYGGKKTVGKNGTRSSLARICVQQTKQRLILHSYRRACRICATKEKGKKKGVAIWLHASAPSDQGQKKNTHTHNIERERELVYICICVCTFNNKKAGIKNTPGHLYKKPPAAYPRTLRGRWISAIMLFFFFFFFL